ncbi:MAG: rhomboid family intramembrane serine protease [Paracoccaceae bacterium]
MDSDRPRVLNAMPAPVWLAVVAILGVEAVLMAAGMGLIGGPQGLGWRVHAIERFSYSAAIQHWMFETHQFPGYNLLRYVSFGFVHASPMHALFGAVIVAALGKAVAETFGHAAFVVLVLPVPALGAAVYGLILGADSRAWLVGALPAGFALVGAFTWHRWRQAANATERRRAFSMIGLLLGARIAFGVFGESAPMWVAELACFAIAFGASALFLGPGSWQRTRAVLKGRSL